VKRDNRDSPPVGPGMVLEHKPPTREQVRAAILNRRAVDRVTFDHPTRHEAAQRHEHDTRDLRQDEALPRHNNGGR
jgi:hypothetical protein